MFCARVVSTATLGIIFSCPKRLKAYLKKYLKIDLLRKMMYNNVCEINVNDVNLYLFIIPCC